MWRSQLEPLNNPSPEQVLLSPFTDVETEVHKTLAQGCILIWGRVGVHMQDSPDS